LPWTRSQAWKVVQLLSKHEEVGCAEDTLTRFLAHGRSPHRRRTRISSRTSLSKVRKVSSRLWRSTTWLPCRMWTVSTGLPSLLVCEPS
jgi:hypothetical protein